MDEKAKRWDVFVRDICQRRPEELSEQQKNAVLCYRYDAQVREGGHDSYLDRYPEVRHEEMIAALKAVANEDIVRNYREASVYGGRDHYREADARFNAAMPSLRDYLRGYVEQHREAVFAPPVDPRAAQEERKRKRKKRRRALLRVVCALIALYLIATTVDIVRYRTVDETQAADVIIVLGAAAADDGVSPVFRERLNHAVGLYEDGLAMRIILTGGVGEGNARSDAAIARDYVQAQGVPAWAILLEDQSTITQGNLENAKKLMSEHGYRSALIVSDPLHMRRAMMIAEDCGLTAYSSPTRTSMYRSPQTWVPFLLREEFFYVGYRWMRLIHKVLPG